uniref:TSA: Wollemia nobilis Ref_Wollemi_Transcript_22230_923 transcribed RNA sequence n=1 Tax=Wollemia nobilis TaxID=56998 RepID=A0A0C9S4W0_9CONI
MTATATPSLVLVPVPPNLVKLLERPDSPLISANGQLYIQSDNPVFTDFNGGKMKLEIDGSTEVKYIMFSAKALSITGSDDSRYWQWISRDDSNFPEVAKLTGVCLFEVKGRFDCTYLHPARFCKVYFILKLQGAYGWNQNPVWFKIETARQQEWSFLFLSDMNRLSYHPWKASFNVLPNNWIEVYAGQISVNETNNSSQNDMKFTMKLYEYGSWKGGLILDSVKIQPVY